MTRSFGNPFQRAGTAYNRIGSACRTSEKISLKTELEKVMIMSEYTREVGL